MNLIEALQAMKEGKKCIFCWQRTNVKYYFIKNNKLWFKRESGEELESKIGVFKMDVDEWEIYEEPKPILDAEEKAYLNSVLRPFKGKIRYIKKNVVLSRDEFIEISVENFYCGSFAIQLPVFKKGTMYKNMKINKSYSAEELGLFDRKIY